MSLKRIELESSLSLKNFTTIKIGGRAEFFFLINGTDELRQALVEFGPSCNILGNGSNLLIKDSTIIRPVIKLGQRFSYIKRSGDTIEVGASTHLSSLISYCLKHNLSGLENLVGIPATIGGLIALNASAYGREVSSCLVELCLMDREGNIQKLKRADLVFDYRSSSIGERIILWARFNLSESVSLKQQLNILLKKRLSSQDFRYPSCGCVFKNPKAKLAGLLIDSCGLKGATEGDAQVSPKHANFIINRGRARYQDVDCLITKIKSEVYKKYSIILEEEIKRWT